jgi:hypothetical protein
MKKIIKWIALVLGALLLSSVVAFVLWGLNPAAPMDEALVAMNSSETVTVQTEPWLVFQPAHKAPTTGLIFYPGGHVDPRAYAPPAQKIAENGYLVVIVPMPLNLAVFGAGKAEAVISAYPEIQNWVIAGHSLGGSMAASYADNNPDSVAGIVLWAHILPKVIIYRISSSDLNLFMGLWMAFLPSPKFKPEPFLPPDTRQLLSTVETMLSLVGMVRSLGIMKPQFLARTNKSKSSKPPWIYWQV